MRVPHGRAVAAAFAVAAILTAVTPCAILAAAPPPKPALPKIALHTEVVVEVNKKGQVVRVKSTKPCKVQAFNVQTFGNALQMWIRKPDGSAQVGLYRVTYDYDPKTERVTRKVALVSLGGNWGDDEGAANVMIDALKKQAIEARRRQQEESSKLPSLNEIRGVSPSPGPTAASTHPPH